MADSTFTRSGEVYPEAKSPRPPANSSKYYKGKQAGAMQYWSVPEHTEGARGGDPWLATFGGPRGTHLDEEGKREFSITNLQAGRQRVKSMLHGSLPNWRGECLAPEVSNLNGENIKRLRNLVSLYILRAQGELADEPAPTHDRQRESGFHRCRDRQPKRLVLGPWLWLGCRSPQTDDSGQSPIKRLGPHSKNSLLSIQTSSVSWAPCGSSVNFLSMASKAA